jgi:hypothetical protein
MLRFYIHEDTVFNACYCIYNYEDQQLANSLKGRKTGVGALSNIPDPWLKKAKTTLTLRTISIHIKDFYEIFETKIRTETSYIGPSTRSKLLNTNFNFYILFYTPPPSLLHKTLAYRGHACAAQIDHQERGSSSSGGWSWR